MSEQENKQADFGEQYQNIYNAILDDITEEFESLDSDLQTLPDDKSDFKTIKGGKIKNDSKIYLKELVKLQIELVKLQDWVQETGYKLVIIFEGRDAAGKGSVIKRITQKLNPRIYKVVALSAPTERERSQWYFQRYISHLPAAGEIVMFDRSWYNRAGVEKVMGFCTEEEYQEFLHTVPEFEKMLCRSGIHLIKYWFSISD